MSIEAVETHTILPDIISSSIVVDCGPNVGRFSLEMIRRFGCICYAIEAAPDTFNKMSNRQTCIVTILRYAEPNKIVTMSIDEDITRSTLKGFRRRIWSQFKEGAWGSYDLAKPWT